MGASWLSFDALKWLLATLLIPLCLAILSYQYQSAQTDRQATDAKLRLYTELLSKREEADTGVRKGIFDKVLETYLKPGAGDLEAKLVALELLALNFNDSLDLSPLFWQIDRQIRQPKQAKQLPFLLTQLERITNDVKDRQIEVLESVGESKEVDVNLEGLQNDSGKAIDQDLSFVDPDPAAANDQRRTRHFTVEIAEHDPVGRRIWVFVTHKHKDDAKESPSLSGFLVDVFDFPLTNFVRTSKSERYKDDAKESLSVSGFWVDVFDFPLTNFVRTSKSERFTVMMRRYKPPRAALTLIYFPSSRSGVKDKPFLDEVISDLRRKAQ